MTNFEKEMEELAEKLSLGKLDDETTLEIQKAVSPLVGMERTTRAVQILEHRAFFKGAQAAKAYFEKAGLEFDKVAAAEKFGELALYDNDYIELARWQFDQLAPLLAARDLKIKELIDKYDAVVNSKAELVDKYVALKEQALEKGRQG